MITVSLYAEKIIKLHVAQQKLFRKSGFVKKAVNLLNLRKDKVDFVYSDFNGTFRLVLISLFLSCRTMGLSIGMCSGLAGFVLADRLIIYLVS